MSERSPGARGETVREAIRRSLLAGPATARDLSTEVGVREKDVAEHLAHLQKSLAHRGERLVVTPAACIACGFAFRERERLSRRARARSAEARGSIRRRSGSKRSEP
jgi:transcriptional regulator